MEFVLLHIPHIIPALRGHGLPGALRGGDGRPAAGGVLRRADRGVAPRAHRARARPAGAPASARLGLLSLPFLVMAVATGLWLYTVALRDDRPSALAIWLHVVTSAVALALVTSKVAESGRARLSRGLDPSRS